MGVLGGTQNTGALSLKLAAVEAETMLAAYDRRKRLEVVEEERAKLIAEIGTDARPAETEEEIISRLAAMPLLEFEKVRKAEAERMGIRASLLDKLVDANRSENGVGNGLQGTAVTLPEIDPWPEPVDGADVLDQVAASLARYVALPDGAADAIALWCAHAHAFQAFTCTPRLNVTSPEKGCGKSTLRDVVALFVPRPVLAEKLSRSDADQEGIGVALLSDIKLVFPESRLFSKDIVERLVSLSDRPWSEVHKGRPITEVWLARKLKTFNITPRTLRIADERAKGYERTDFADVFDRYLPGEGESTRDVVTSPAGVDRIQFSNRDTVSGCHASKAHETPANIGLSRCHGSKPPEGKESTQEELL